MHTEMPRGAIPSPRSELAAAAPYTPGSDGPIGELAVPSGAFPSPNHELAAGRPYRASGAPPESFLVWPAGIAAWGAETAIPSSWAEEAFAKACAEPRMVLTTEEVLAAVQACGVSNFARFMQTCGFRVDGAAYLDGPFLTVDWTDQTALESAIAEVGPVKIGVAAAAFARSPDGRVTPGKSGWAVQGLAPGEAEDHCASLCGYGPLEALVERFAGRGVAVAVPKGMPSGPCYALFAWDSIGLIDRPSLLAATGEAWVRAPTSIVRRLVG